MASSTTLNETTRSPIDLTEYIRLATTGANWKAQLSAITGLFVSTGDAKLTFKTAADTGWILCDDGSIGDVASNATTRANADTSALFVLLWKNIAALVVQDSYDYTVSRRASAAAVFA